VSLTGNLVEDSRPRHAEALAASWPL
jgi:hypothetical protein